MARINLYGLFFLFSAWPSGDGVRAFAAGSLEFNGTVSCDGKPVAGAAVTLYLEGREEQRSATDAQGKFRFELPYGSHCKVTVEKESYIGMTIEINTTVPARDRNALLMYNTKFDIFMEKEGFEAVLAREPLMKVEYIPSKQNFGTKVPYENAVTYTPLKDKEKPVFTEQGIESVKDQPVKEEEKHRDKDVQKQADVDPDEAGYLRAREEEQKQADRREELAETTAGEQREEDAGKMDTDRLAGSADEQVKRKLEEGALRDSLEREKEAEKAETMENRKVKADARKRFMADIADALREEKDRKKTTKP